MARSRQNVKSTSCGLAIFSDVTNTTYGPACGVVCSGVRLTVLLTAFARKLFRARPRSPGEPRHPGPRGTKVPGPHGFRGPGTWADCARSLLDRDGRTGPFQGGPGLVRGLLVDPLQERLGRRVDQVLGLLEAEAGQAADFLDDLDLLVASALQDDVELILLLGWGRVASGAGRGGGGGRDGRGGLDVKCVLELLHELGELQEGHLLERVEQIVGAELRHDAGFLFLRFLRSGSWWPAAIRQPRRCRCPCRRCPRHRCPRCGCPRRRCPRRRWLRCRWLRCR